MVRCSIGIELFLIIDKGRGVNNMSYVHDVNGELHLDESGHNTLKLIIKEKRFLDNDSLFMLYAETDLNKNRPLTYSVICKNFHDADGSVTESSRWNTYNYMRALNDYMTKVCTESNYLHRKTMKEYYSELD